MLGGDAVSCVPDDEFDPPVDRPTGNGDDSPGRGVLGRGALFLLLILLPFVDRNPERSWRRRPVAIGIGLLVLTTVVVLTLLMVSITPATHLGM